MLKNKYIEKHNNQIIKNFGKIKKITKKQKKKNKNY